MGDEHGVGIYDRGVAEVHLYLALLQYADSHFANRKDLTRDTKLLVAVESLVACPLFDAEALEAARAACATLSRPNKPIETWALTQLARLLGLSFTSEEKQKAFNERVQAFRKVALHCVYERLYCFACGVLDGGDANELWVKHVGLGLATVVRAPEFMTSELKGFAKANPASLPEVTSPSTWARDATGPVLGHSKRWGRGHTVTTKHRKYASAAARAKSLVSNASDFDDFTTEERFFYRLDSRAQELVLDEIRNAMREEPRILRRNAARQSVLQDEYRDFRIAEFFDLSVTEKRALGNAAGVSIFQGDDVPPWKRRQNRIPPLLMEAVRLGLEEAKKRGLIDGPIKHRVIISGFETSALKPALPRFAPLPKARVKPLVLPPLRSDN